MANCIRCGRQLPPLTFGKKVCEWCVRHEAAQRGEDGDDARQPVMAVPWTRRESSITLTHVLFGANIAIFLAMAIASGSATNFPPNIGIHFGANYGPLTLTGQWWRLVTYMFLHGGLLHIAFNMWCLWDLGALCESLYGRWTFAVVYLITGVAGGLASVAWNPGVLSVGASGAIFGLAGALIASFYLGEFSLPRVAIGGTLRSLLVFAGFNLFLGGFLGGVDNACHVGGLVSGLMLGALIARVAPQTDAPTRRASVLTVGALIVLFAALGVNQWRGRQMRAWNSYENLIESGPEGEIERLQTIIRQQPNSARAHFDLGQAYFNFERYPDAEAEFKRVLELQPQENRARFDLGLTYLSEKRTDDAKAAFTQLINQNPNDSDAHYGIGLTLAAESNHQAAIEEFKTAIRLGPEESGVYYELGQSYAKLKMYDDAIKAYLEEKDKNGDNLDIETGLADCYQAKGMTQQANEAKTRAAQLKNAPHN
jgi:membrane associated rhomboid family serine protease/cytochrome c-type biogenesis protein CcmH/NrfG